DITVGSGETVRVTAEAGDDIDAILERIESAGISGITDVSVTGEQGEAFQATLAFAEASLAESVSREFTFQAGGSLQTVTVANGPGETDGIDAARMADAINEQADGITAVASDTGGNVILTAIGDTAITVGDTDDANGFTAGDISQAVGSAIVTPGALTIQANDEFTIVDGSATGLFANVDNVEGVTAELSGSLEDVDVLSVANANEAINRVDSALDAVNNVRSELGAIQNRFESTIANLASTSENLSAANSRILDADFAAETANLSQSQVLQQAGISVLAQANARPQQVLSLLQ
ncbi:MAG: flagellar protein FlaB, partial [Halomonadaceae bacterium]